MFIVKFSFAGDSEMGVEWVWHFPTKTEESLLDYVSP